MTKTAWVFPGQGSQTIGMGVDLQQATIAQEKFQLRRLEADGLIKLLPQISPNF